MEEVKRRLLAKGGTLGDWTGLVTNGLQTEELLWVDAATYQGDILGYARGIMSQGSIVEYECYDARGRPQGKALVRLVDWDDFASGTLKAEHLCASDEYYEWYGQHELSGGKAVYHLCGSKRTECAARLGRGDRREMIHLERWRMTNPMVMLEHDYSKEVAMRALNNWVNNFAPKVPEPPNPPELPGGARGSDHTGLDKAVESAALAAEVEKEKPGRRETEDKTVQQPRGSVGALLEKKAAERRAAFQEKVQEKKRRRMDRGRSRSRGRRRRHGKRSSSEDRGGSGRSSESSRSFREPSSRVEAEMWRLSQKNPGSLLRKGMIELGRYLADRAPCAEGEETWMNSRVMAYISQVVLSQHPPNAIGVRNHRELLTLGRALDMLLQGQLGELGDLLIQRLKALETSFVDQGWHSARHQELIPPHAATLTTESERRRTARMEIAANKLKEMTMKGKRHDK